MRDCSDTYIQKMILHKCVYIPIKNNRSLYFTDSCNFLFRCVLGEMQRAEGGDLLGGNLFGGERFGVTLRFLRLCCGLLLGRDFLRRILLCRDCVGDVFGHVFGFFLGFLRPRWQRWQSRHARSKETHGQYKKQRSLRGEKKFFHINRAFCAGQTRNRALREGQRMQK